MRESIAFSIIIAMIIMISILGPMFISKRVEEMTEQKPKVTGHATNVEVSLTLLKRMDLSQLNLSADLSWADNSTVVLSWSNLSADNYSIWISDNVSWIMNDSSLGLPNVTGITDLNWSDPTAGSVKKRFYRLGITYNNLQNISLETVGKFDIPIYSCDSSVPGAEFNSFSLPLIPSNRSINNIFRWNTQNDAFGFYNETGEKFDGVVYFSGFGWTGPFDELNLSYSYWVFVTSQDYNLTVTGKVPTRNQSFPMVFADSSAPGVERYTLPWKSAYTRYGVDDTFPSNATPFDAVMIYNTSTFAWDGILYFAGIGWQGQFNATIPGGGYSFVNVQNPIVWEYDPVGE